MTSGVIAVARSGNSKIGPAAATYVAQKSCPTTCPLLGAGCYAESGRMLLHTRRIASPDGDPSPVELAEREADAIDGLPASGLPLRLHVVGDSPTPAAARIVAAAARRYTRRSPGRAAAVWGYTHAWRDVPASAWRGVHMRASCETGADVAAAQARGYEAAIVVSEHATAKRTGAVIPCVEQTRGVACTECRLCLGGAPSGAVIAFEVHGARAGAARDAIAERGREE